MVRIYKIIEKTNVEGPGTRFCIWVQGCNKHCDGCFAKETWDFSGGKSYSVDKLFNMIQNTKGIDGVTFLGGEPFEQSQELALLCEKIKSINYSIVTFTGYTLEELQNKKDNHVDKMLSYIDLLIDGGFEKDKYDLSRPWVGSSNQRYIFLSDKFSMDELKQYKNKIEVRLSKDGRLDINGMGNFNELEKEFCLQLGKSSVK